MNLGIDRAADIGGALLDHQVIDAPGSRWWEIPIRGTSNRSVRPKVYSLRSLDRSVCFSWGRLPR